MDTKMKEIEEMTNKMDTTMAEYNKDSSSFSSLEEKIKHETMRDKLKAKLNTEIEVQKDNLEFIKVNNENMQEKLKNERIKVALKSKEDQMNLCKSSLAKATSEFEKLRAE